MVYLLLLVATEVCVSLKRKISTGTLLTVGVLDVDGWSGGKDGLPGMLVYLKDIRH